MEDHPVTVTLERLDAGHEGETETVRAKYAVGCDGARSSVRKALGRELKVDRANQAWGVMDVLAVTDFPDIRLKCAIQSASEGSLLIIPREGGHMVRLYIELDELHGDERAADRDVSPDLLIDKARAIMAPHSLDVAEVASLLDLTPENVRVISHRGLSALRASYDRSAANFADSDPKNLRRA